MIDATATPYNVRPERPDLDSTTGLQLALNASSLRAEPVFLRTGRYWFRGNLIFPKNAYLIGDGRGPYDPISLLNPAEEIHGPTLLPLSRIGEAFITLQGLPGGGGGGGNCGLDDLIIFYPEQVKPDAPGVGTTGPIIYPPAIKVLTPSKLRRLYIPNAYEAIHALIGRTYIDDCHLNGYKRGIVVDNARDVVRITDSNISVWHYGLPFPQPLDWWAFAHKGTGITVRRADGLQMSDVLIFGKHIGILLEVSTVPGDTDGAASGQFSNVNLDTVRHGIVASATEERVGVVFTNLLLGPYWDQPGHAIWLQRPESTGNTTPPVVSVIGGSIRHQWAKHPDGTDWAFRVDAGELYKTRIIGDDIGVRR